MAAREAYITGVGQSQVGQKLSRHPLLLTLDASDSLRPYLVTRYWLAFVDLFRDPILWHDVVRGVLLQAGYVVVFLGAAWANFVTKDITD